MVLKKQHRTYVKLKNSLDELNNRTEMTGEKSNEVEDILIENIRPK